MARTLVGIVASDKADKTIVINIAVRKTHPLYKKQYTVNTKFMAHDEKNEAKVGDKVSVVECRPLSARKRFTLSKVLEHANVGFDEKDATADVAEEETSEEKK
jgi:small subunit ribosomal protein S17